MALTKVTTGVLSQTLSLTNVTATNVKTTNLQDTSGNNAINVPKVAGNAARYTRQILNLVDTTDRTSGTTWTAGTTFGEMYGFKANSVLKISYMYPCRNDSTSWGGLYFEPQIRFNGGAWQSLGSRGYDAVMELGNGSISFTSNIMFIDPGLASDYSIALRYYFRSYDGTVGVVNGNGHEINTTSGTASLMSGTNGQQHYGNWIVEELALFK